MSLAEGKTLSQDDYKNIEDVAKIAVKEKQSFERLELPKEVLLEMFKVSSLARRSLQGAVAYKNSTTSTSSTTLTTRSQMEHRPRSTDVDPSSIYVSVPTFPTRAVSSPSL